MQRPHKLLITALVISLLTTIAIVQGATVLSVLYTQFNDEIWKNYQLDKDYTSVTIDIKNFITYNTTTGEPSIKVAFHNDTGGNPVGIQILEKRGGTLEVWKTEGMTDVLIGTGTWQKGKITRVTLTNGYVTVYENYDTPDKAKVIENFAFEDTFSYCRVKGGGSYIATDGYVQIEVDSGTAGLQGTMNEWLPVVIAFAMLGIAVGLIKKLGR